MVTRLSLLCLLTFIVKIGYSQDLSCGTIPSRYDIEKLSSLKVAPTSKSRIVDDAPIKIAISAHIVRNSNGTGGLSETDLTEAIADVNEIYTLTNMDFFLFGDINYIDSDEYFNFNSSDEGALTSVHDVKSTINVYFFNSATSGENSVCGYAYFPSSGIDHIIMVNSCTTNGSTFPHELGHYFALYHTHGKTNTGTTDELVNGSNCELAGDDICDTTADPNLSGKVDDQCVYTGTETDSNGDLYVPNPENLMSYSRKHCRSQFSQGQADRITAAYQEYKTYLIDKTYAADFEVERREVCVGGSLAFSDRSVEAISYNWSFEGGNPASSTEENPIVTYNTAGIYDVTLTIAEEGLAEDTKMIVDFVTVKDNDPSTITDKVGGFENNDIEETIINNDNGITFALNSNASTEGSKSVYMDFIRYSALGEEDYLVLGKFNTSESETIQLDFDYAYAPYDDVYFDGLSIVYRDPCGDWISVWEKFGNDLKTRDAQTNEFFPSNHDFVSESIFFTVADGIDATEIAFKTTNGYGNQLYIDNYAISASNYIFNLDEVLVMNASCPDSEDGSIIVSASGTGQFEYSLDGENFSTSNEIINLSVGDYEVFVRNKAGAIRTETVSVDFENSYPSQPSITESNGALSVILKDGESVRWYLESSLLENEISATIDKADRGVYVAEVYTGECATFSEPFIVLSVDQITTQLKVYPNPVSNQLNISLPEELKKEVTLMSIRDLSGKVIKIFNFRERISVEDLSKGIYILHFEIAGDNIGRRFLKQ